MITDAPGNLFAEWDGFEQGVGQTLAFCGLSSLAKARKPTGSKKRRLGHGRPPAGWQATLPTPACPLTARRGLRRRVRPSVAASWSSFRRGPLPRYVLKAIDKHLASHGTTDDGYLFRAGQLGRGTPGAAAQGRRQAPREARDAGR